MYPPSFITNAGDIWCVGKMISGVCDFVCLCVCVCSRAKWKKTRAIGTKLGIHSPRYNLGMHWPEGQQVKGQGHAVIKRPAVDITAYVFSFTTLYIGTMCTDEEIKVVILFVFLSRRLARQNLHWTDRSSSEFSVGLNKHNVIHSLKLDHVTGIYDCYDAHWTQLVSGWSINESGFVDT